MPFASIPQQGTTAQRGRTSKLRQLLLALLLAALHVLPARSHDRPAADPPPAITQIAQALVDAGLDNVRVRQQADTLYAALENLNHRATYRGVGIALKTLAQAAPHIAHFQILVKEYDHPQVAVSAHRLAQSWNVHVHHDIDPLEQIIASAPQGTAASTRGKIDLVLHPIVSIDNHKLDKIVEAALFFAPSIEATLWRGNRFFVQPILPVAHNLAKGNPDRLIQVGAMGVRQDWHVGRRWEVSATIGSFLYNLYGIHAEAAYHASPRFDLGARLGIMGTQIHLPGRWEFTAPKHIHAMATADYYHPGSSLQAKISAGFFTYGDLGLRGDLVRHFGEFAIGVYGIYTKGEKNAGFNFALPLSSRRQLRKGTLRVRLPQYFAWEYSMLNYYRYRFENMGVLYKERPDKSFTTHYWQAAFLQQYLQRYLDGAIR